MINLVYSPKWFYGKDIAIDIISSIVLFLIAFFSYKYYRLGKKRNNILLSASFSLIGLSFLFKILTNFTIYYTKIRQSHFGFFIYSYKTVELSNFPFYFGFFMYRFLTLFGLYLLYSIYTKQRKTDMLIVVYLLFTTTLFGMASYYVFHVSAFILLSIITSHYFRNSRKTESITNRMLSYSFLVISISQVLFVFIAFKTMYAVAEAVQLIGYLMLLITLFMVLTYGKKKKQN